MPPTDFSCRDTMINFFKSNSFFPTYTDTESSLSSLMQEYLPAIMLAAMGAAIKPVQTGNDQAEGS